MADPGRSSFWKHEPVSTSPSASTTREILRRPPSETPSKLPPGLLWAELDLKTSSDLASVTRFLSENYVESSDSRHRFGYSAAFLKFALVTPSYSPCFSIGIKDGSRPSVLIGFVSATRASLFVSPCSEEPLKIVDINFLCVSKKLRAQGLAPVLIKEITRRANLNGIWQAFYSGSEKIHLPLATANYWHRPLKVLPLLGAGLLSGRIESLVETYKVDRVSDKKLVELKGASVLEETHQLYHSYVHDNFEYARVYGRKEWDHVNSTIEGVVYPYVWRDKGNGKVRAYASIYICETKVIESAEEESVRFGYLYNVMCEKNDELELMRELVQIAEEKGCDMFNVLDNVVGEETRIKLKFGRGDGILQYFVYNWRYSSIDGVKLRYSIF